MKYKEWPKPDKLMDWGFSREDEPGGDRVRWVWYKYEVPIDSSDMHFEIIVTYCLCLSDSPTATYLQNMQYTYERTECLLKDNNGQIMLKTTFDFQTKKDLDRLKYMFR